MLKILTASDLLQEVQELFDKGMHRGDKTGWVELDRLFSVVPGYWTAITGIPSHGKSTWLDNLIVNLMAQGWRFVIYSPENQPHQIHVASLVEKITQATFRTGYPHRISAAQLCDAMAKLDANVRFLALPEDAHSMATLDNILERADEALDQLGDSKVGVVIDPWNELDHSRVQGMTETEFTSYELSIWRQYNRSRETHGFIVAHPTKIQRIRHKDGSVGQFIVPSLYDISGSSHWFNKCDNGITVWRDEDKPGTCEIHIKKIKFKHHGTTGIVTLDYDASTGVYRDTLDYDTRRHQDMGQRPYYNRDD